MFARKAKVACCKQREWEPCDLHNRLSIIYSAAHMTFSSFFSSSCCLFQGLKKGAGSTDALLCELPN